jgi:lipoate-protein ligase A
MDAPTVRLLPYEIADGAANMAADEVLLEAASQGKASLRCYGWSVPTLSLGYFQAAAARSSDPCFVELPWVRRATGGEALVHHFEITYALALPSGLPWQKHGDSWICRMHGIIRAALSSLGVPRQGCGETEEKRLGDFLCYLHHTPGDVLLDGHKVVGSAQRKRHGALLQHGGILLATSPFTPALPGINDLCGAQLTNTLVREAVTAEFVRQTGWMVHGSEWTAAERHRCQELTAGRYANPLWNAKR